MTGVLRRMKSMIVAEKMRIIATPTVSVIKLCSVMGAAMYRLYNITVTDAMAVSMTSPTKKRLIELTILSTFYLPSRLICLIVILIFFFSNYFF